MYSVKIMELEVSLIKIAEQGSNPLSGCGSKYVPVDIWSISQLEKKIE